jgi:hypothetical protein
MENLILSARIQFRDTAKVVCAIYPNRDYEEAYEIICYTLSDAIELISFYFLCPNDDIHISALN